MFDIEKQLLNDIKLAWKYERPELLKSGFGAVTLAVIGCAFAFAMFAL